MAIRTRIDHEHRVVCIELDHAFDPVALMQREVEVWADETLRGFDVFGVIAEGTAMSPSADEIRTLAQFQAEHLVGRRRRLAVVTPTDLHFGLVRMFEAFWGEVGPEEDVHVFRTAAEAKAWLDLPQEWTPEG